jgi:hypothetical protein
MKIKKLDLFTSNLAKQKEFYSLTLGFPILIEKEDFVSFKIGDSILSFESKEKHTPYHFALNIPSILEKQALEWLTGRVEIIRDGQNEIQYFDFWDAYAMYFYDADNNIVELIARRGLKAKSDHPFSMDSIINISEIGVPTNDIKQVYEVLNKEADINIFSGSLERFCAAGDEEGIFIIINRLIKKEWYPTQDEPFISDFKIEFSQNNKDYQFEYNSGKLSLSPFQ